MPLARPDATSRKAAFWSGNECDVALGNVFWTSCSAVDPCSDVIVLLASFHAAIVAGVVSLFCAARICAYGTYARLKLIDFRRSGVADRPTETMSNFFETRPGIKPLKSRFLMLSVTPHFFASAFRSTTSYPAGLPAALRYI